MLNHLEKNENNNSVLKLKIQIAIFYLFYLKNILKISRCIEICLQKLIQFYMKKIINIDVNGISIDELNFYSDILVMYDFNRHEESTESCQKFRESYCFTCFNKIKNKESDDIEKYISFRKLFQCNF